MQHLNDGRNKLSKVECGRSLRSRPCCALIKARPNKAGFPLALRSRPTRPLAFAADTAAHPTLRRQQRRIASLTACYALRGLPCPRTPAALRVVGSASAACASSRYSRCGMTLRAPVAFSFRHPALCMRRGYERGFAAPRAGWGPPLPPLVASGLPLIVPPSALAHVFNYFACRPLAHHHRFWALSSPWGLRAFSGSSLCPRL